MSNKNGIPTMSEQSGAVVLPCSTKDFGSFISGLLGKPQTISNMIRGPFEISRDDILNVHSLLTQRISQQNEAVLTQFTAKLVFNDESSVLLNSVEDFNAYNEVRPVACLALHLSWVFLVKFQDKDHPEKQQIDISFLAGSGPPMIDRDTPIVIVGGSDTGHISYRISHTARTWGADIDALLTSHLKGVVDEIPAYRKWLARHDDKLAIFTFCSLVIASIVGAFSASTSFVSEQREKISALMESSKGDVVTPEQLNFLLDTVATGTWERFLLVSAAFLLLSVVVSVLISVWVGSTADNLPPSFILLTNESNKRKQRILARRRNKWLSFIGAIAVGVATGIGGNIAYALWFEKLIQP